MLTRKFIKYSLIIAILFSVCFLVYNNFKIKKKDNDIVDISNNINEQNYNSNIMSDVKYSSKDSSGNEFIIEAKKAEIDLSNPNILYLTNINAVIILNNADKITIISDYGKYNSENFDTIFSKNVIIKYLDNKITGEYLDFSLDKNQMIISKNVIYSNFENVMMADVIEMNIKTKNTKIYMHESNKKVKVKNK